MKDVLHFSLSPSPLAFLAWGDFHARSRFARSTSLRKNGDYSGVVYGTATTFVIAWTVHLLQ